MIDIQLTDKEFEIDDLFDYFYFIQNKINDTGKINLLENEKLKEYNNCLSKINSNDLIEENLKMQEIKLMTEKISEFMKNKKESNYVSDFYLREDIFDQNENINLSDDNNSELDLSENFNDNNFTNLKTNNSDILLNASNVYELYALTSNEFLKNNLNLNENDIKLLKKGNVIEDEENNINITKNNEKEEKIDNKPKVDTTNKKIETFLKNNEIRNGKKIEKKIPEEVNKLEKEMDEELNNEIFNYVKNMKNYAFNFSQILIQDNQKLEKIEKIQTIDKTKTNRSIKSLNEFNYSLKIGFWKLILYFIIIGVTFIFTLISIRIFPKLVN